MALSLRYVVRSEASKLLRSRYPGRFLCADRLGPPVRAALGTACTKAQVAWAVRLTVTSPGDLQCKLASVCDGCGQLRSCFGVESG